LFLSVLFLSERQKKNQKERVCANVRPQAPAGGARLPLVPNIYRKRWIVIKGGVIFGFLDFFGFLKHEHRVPKRKETHAFTD
jgi:hypothetical protein